MLCWAGAGYWNDGDETVAGLWCVGRFRCDMKRAASSEKTQTQTQTQDASTHKDWSLGERAERNKASRWTGRADANRLGWPGLRCLGRGKTNGKKNECQSRSEDGFFVSRSNRCKVAGGGRGVVGSKERLLACLGVDGFRLGFKKAEGILFLWRTAQPSVRHATGKVR